MERRTFLAAAAGTALLPIAARGATADDNLSNDVVAALTRFRSSIPSNFDRDYVEHVVVPFFLESVYQGERPMLPMIDLPLTKENALPFDLWGLIYKEWRPTPEEGVTVFLQGLEKRGDDNLRKRIYFSAMTPDLYGPKYQKKVVAFFDRLLDPAFAGKPFMRHYLDYYFDIYWDLHLGVKGEAIPLGVRQIGESFNTVLAYRNPTRQIVYENYMKVRELLDPLKDWIDERVKDLESGRTADPDKTIAWYWLKNAGNGEHFSRKDIVFEVFHNFVALSQWGNTIFGIMSRLSKFGGDADVQAAFVKTMSGDYDQATDGAFTPLQLFVMELFRTISPNGGSLSAIEDAPRSFYGESPHALLDARFRRYGYMNTPHTSTSFDPVHWPQPQQFDPDRYKTVPTSEEIDEAKCKQIGFARCPFDITSLAVADGRKASLTNSGFGTVFGVVDGKALPVTDYAGFAPFGFGYRRCPGEQLTIQVFEDFLRKVWKEKIEFVRLNLPSPGEVPIGPTAVIEDDIAFTRSA
jgi:hypothetical protein